MNTATSSVKVLVPAALLDKRLYTADGKVFTVEKHHGLLTTKRVLTENANFFEDGLDTQAIKKTVAAIEKSVATEAKKYIDQMVIDGISSIEPLTKIIAQELRKTLISNSAGQLKILFTDFFQKNDERISKAFSHNTKDVITRTSFIPKATRFIWEMKSDAGFQYSIYCIELSPHRRNIWLRKETETNSALHNWVLPWTYILAVFKDGKFSYLTAFYRRDRVTKADDNLQACGLPGKYNEAPWTYCDNHNTPDIQIADPNWVDRLLTWFFDSTFIYHDRACTYDDEYDNLMNTIPEMRTFSDWDSFSKQENAVEKVCKIPFPILQRNLNQIVIEIMKYASKNKSLIQSAVELKKEELVKLGEMFQQAAMEKFVFLVEKTTINIDIAEKVRSVFKQSLNSLKLKLSNSIVQKISGLGKTIQAILFKQIVGKVEEI